MNVQGFQTTVDQTVLNERVWWSTGIQQNQTHQKNRSFNFWSQSNFEFGYRTKWNKIKLSNSELLMASMLIYWSSVKAVKAILILVSFIISIFGVNSKINILCENVSAFVYRKNVLKLQVEIILGIISIIILSCLESQHNYSTFWIQHSLDFPNLLLSQSWLSFHVWFFFQYDLVYFDFVRASNSPKSCVW